MAQNIAEAIAWKEECERRMDKEKNAVAFHKREKMAAQRQLADAVRIVEEFAKQDGVT